MQIVGDYSKKGFIFMEWSKDDTPRIADDTLAQPLRKAGVDVRLVGDCVAPRNLLCAIHEGEAAATAI